MGISLCLFCTFLSAAQCPEPSTSLCCPGLSSTQESDSSKIQAHKVCPKEAPLCTCDSTSSQKYRPQLQLALSEIQAVLDEIKEPCSMKEPAESGPCSLMSVGFTSKEGHAYSKGQRILFLDDGMFLPAFVRYKSRVLDFLDFDGQGNAYTTRGTAQIPKAAYQILSQILDEKYPEVSAYSLKPIKQQYSKKLPSKDIIEVNSPRHGDPIFVKLAEYNPRSEFLLGHFPDALHLDPCTMDEDTQILEKYKTYYDRVIQSLTQAIQKHDINFIILAVTHDHRITYICEEKKVSPGKVDALLQAYLNHFYKPLFSMPGIISVQAVELSKPFDKPAVRYSYPVDCASFPRRLRIGVFGKLDSGVGPEGTAALDLLPEYEKQTLPCMDLIVNLGEVRVGDEYSLPEKPPFPCGVPFTLGQGIGSTENPYLSTSFASPVALSYLIYLKNTLPPGTSPEEIIRIATSDGKGFIKDPIRNRQIEAYRLGYLDP